MAFSNENPPNQNSSQTRFPSQALLQAHWQILPKKFAIWFVTEAIVLLLMFFDLCKVFILLWKQEQRAGEEVVKQPWIELGETSQEVTWQDFKYYCINHAISQHFSEIQARQGCRVLHVSNRSCCKSYHKSWDLQPLKQKAQSQPAHFCTILVTTLPGGLPHLTAQQKYSLNFISLGELLENCSKEKQGLNIKSQSQSPQGLLSGYLPCSASGQVCWLFWSQVGWISLQPCHGAKHNYFNTITNNPFTQLFDF